MPVRLVELEVPIEEADIAADRLWCAGARGVEEIDLGPGRVGLRSVLGADPGVSVDRLGPLPESWRLSFVDVDAAPAETWRDFARPVEVGERLVIRPAWCAPLTGDRLEIEIEPGGSFGLGDHPTTQLTAAAAMRLVVPGSRVLDVGCGSGVLAIVAARLGAERAIGIDIADAAIDATLDNARRNEVADVVSADTRPLAEIDEAFDLVLANVLAPALVAMADDLRRCLAPGGSLVVSGILADRHEHVVEALRPLRVVRVDTLDAWAAVELSSRSPG